MYFHSDEQAYVNSFTVSPDWELGKRSSSFAKQEAELSQLNSQAGDWELAKFLNLA